VATVIRRERYQRGIFGWIFKLLFIAFNVFMFAVLVVLWVGANQTPTDPRDTMHVGAAITAGATMMLAIPWVLGDIILGLLTYFTRGTKVIVEETV